MTAPPTAEAAERAGGPIVATKLHVPPVLAGRVSRPSLVAELRDNVRARLILISAPAGAGKTTVMASWRADPEEQRPFAWLSLDDRDNDPVRFWGYVLAAVRTVAPDLGGGVDDALRAAGDDLTELALPLLVNALTSLAQPIVLVLDDYHAISNADSHQSMEFLLDHLPHTVEVAVAARADPPFTLARLRANAELLELRIADLRLSAEEADGLSNQSLQLGLAPDQVRILRERTEAGRRVCSSSACLSEAVTTESAISRRSPATSAKSSITWWPRSWIGKVRPIEAFSLHERALTHTPQAGCFDVPAVAQPRTTSQGIHR